MAPTQHFLIQHNTRGPIGPTRITRRTSIFAEAAVLRVPVGECGGQSRRGPQRSLQRNGRVRLMGPWQRLVGSGTDEFTVRARFGHS
jgi:hypothetical protein